MNYILIFYINMNNTCGFCNNCNDDCTCIKLYKEPKLKKTASLPSNKLSTIKRVKKFVTSLEDIFKINAIIIFDGDKKEISKFFKIEDINLKEKSIEVSLYSNNNGSYTISGPWTKNFNEILDTNRKSIEIHIPNSDVFYNVKLLGKNVHLISNYFKSDPKFEHIKTQIENLYRQINPNKRKSLSENMRITKKVKFSNGFGTCGTSDDELPKHKPILKKHNAVLELSDSDSEDHGCDDDICKCHDSKYHKGCEICDENGWKGCVDECHCHTIELKHDEDKMEDEPRKVIEILDSDDELSECDEALDLSWVHERNKNRAKKAKRKHDKYDSDDELSEGDEVLDLSWVRKRKENRSKKQRIDNNKTFTSGFCTCDNEECDIDYNVKKSIKRRTAGFGFTEGIEFCTCGLSDDEDCDDNSGSNRSLMSELKHITEGLENIGL